MICGKCGNQCDANEAFCNCCGTPLNVAQNYQSYDPSMQNMDNSNVLNYQDFGDASAVTSKAKLSFKNKKIGIIATVAVAVILVVTLFIGVFGSTPEKTAKNCVEFICSSKGDADDIWKYIDKDMFKESLKEEGLSTSEVNDEIEDFEDELMDAKDDLEDDDIKLKSVKVLYTGEMKKSSFEDIVDDYEEIGVKVKDAKKVLVNVMVEKDGEKIWEPNIINVVKIGSKWYLDIMNFGFLGGIL